MPSLLIAGSDPSVSLREIVSSYPNAHLLVNFDDILQVHHSASVLVNPMLRGGGVALKTVEMLRSGRRVVSTSAGAAGLPRKIRNLMTIADDPKAFAAGVHAGRTNTDLDLDASRIIERHFGFAAIRPLLERLHAVKMSQPSSVLDDID